MTISKSLRTWFVIHCILDVMFAIPMMVAPVAFLSLFGWPTVDPFMTRLVAAALMGIGIESYLGRNAGVEAYQGMLNLKIIWSAFAILGLLISVLTLGGPWTAWLIIAIFVGFNILWVYYRLQLREE
jgi:hypothetical protein